MPEQLRAAKGIETETGIDGQADRQTDKQGQRDRVSKRSTIVTYMRLHVHI